MITLVDANVLLDIFTDDPSWRDWSQQHLFEALVDGEAVVNPIIYAEISGGFAHEKELIDQLTRLGIGRVPLPFEAAFPAMRAFIKYRRSGGRKHSPLPDFYIGAHAQISRITLLTRDSGRYQTYFPT
ncbi:MAG: type II toxin-antitoxin system VapC family toxin, partial [Spirochaetales bacterium]|nr:type II toxin-antitoxin system VapC family toxin [Spirochaetales bacterium]